MKAKSGSSAQAVKKDGKDRVSQSEAARRLGMTPQALGRWTDRPGAPVELTKGRPYCVWPDFPKWRDAELTRKAKEEAGPADFEKAKARKMAAEAELAEMELARARGELVTVADAGERLAKILERVRSRLVAFPGKLAPRLVGVDTAMEARGVLEGAVAEVLTELSSGGATTPARSTRKKAA